MSKIKTFIRKFQQDIKKGMKNTEDYDINDRFTQILELIYSIALAIGVYKLMESFTPTFQASDILPILICGWVLIRFFFAPSKNIAVLGRKGGIYKWIIMLFDVMMLLMHALIYYLMCSRITLIEKFYFYFSLLLFFNSIWLITIWRRLSKSNESTPYYIKFWIINNILFSSFLFLIVKFQIWETSWKVLLFTLAFLNCFLDLRFTYPAYIGKDRNKE